MTASDLSSDQARDELVGLLDGLVTSTGLKTLVLVTRNGSVVNARGDMTYFDVTALAALLGAMFTATSEVARLVGEDHFSILLQQGEKRHIHISLISNGYMLCGIFEDVGKIGLIRMHTRRVAERVGELALVGTSTAEATVALHVPVQPQANQGRLAGSREVSKPSEAPQSGFREYALDLIDQIFAED